VGTVKNKSELPAPGSGLGPAPVRASVRPALSGPRGTVLERLQRSTGPRSVAALAEELGVHPNTAREHLDALVEQGLATRERFPAAGRGRPAWGYSADADRLEPDPRVRDYAGLATALAGHLTRQARDPAAEGLAAGREWGASLVESHPDLRRPDDASARHRVVALLDELGFAPEADVAATTVALRRCPLLDAARKYPEVVCQVHLGIVRGALDRLGGDPEPTALLPFAEPGACRLHLVTAGVGAAHDDG
jgi:predicted ArsR family transcriptional regulator